MARIKLIPIVFAAILISSSCSVHSKLTQIDDYLYSVEYSKYDFDKLAKFADMLLYSKKKLPAPACSAVRCDSLFGRNFDWYYDEMPEFVIFTNASGGRFASLGIASPIGILKKKQVKGLWGQFVLDKLPAFTVDGINEKGVVCCVNVVPQGDCGYTVGTNPGKPRLYAAMLVRYVLDYAASAQEAIELLESRDFYTSVAFGLQEDYHFLIADNTDTYVVEFVDNHPVALKDRKIMTNFHLCGELTPHSMGVERYESLEKGFDQASTQSGMFELLKSVWYSNFYTETEHPWMSELCSSLEKYGLTIQDIKTAPEKFEKPFEEERNMYENRSRKKGKTWQSVHSSIYDLKSGTLSISTQEGETKHCFRLISQEKK